MVRQTQVHKSTKKALVVGMLLSLAIIGVGGCGSTNTTSSPAGSGAQPSSSSQQSQGQTTQKPDQNPALKAVMEISRLQRNQENALTSDQKAKLKPILQELISTSSNGNSTNENRPQGGNGGQQSGNAPKPQDMYQRVLDSLT